MFWTGSRAHLTDPAIRQSPCDFRGITGIGLRHSVTRMAGDFGESKLTLPRRSAIMLCSSFVLNGKYGRRRWAGMRASDNPTADKREEENIDRLHAHEEQLRIESLAIIAKCDDLSDHWRLVQEAMNVIYA